MSGRRKEREGVFLSVASLGKRSPRDKRSLFSQHRFPDLRFVELGSSRVSSLTVLKESSFRGTCSASSKTKRRRKKAKTLSSLLFSLLSSIRKRKNETVRWLFRSRSSSPFIVGGSICIWSLAAEKREEKGRDGKGTDVNLR